MAQQTAKQRRWVAVLLLVAGLGGRLFPVVGDQQSLIFHDSFDGLPSCVSGTIPSESLGPLPSATPELIACVEVSSELALDRTGEVAWGSIPIPAVLALSDAQLDRLVLAAPGGLRVPAQFQVTSRWGGALADTTRPIRWLGLAIPTALSRASTVTYAVLRYPLAQPAADPLALSVTQGSGHVTIDTGAAIFELDPTNPALFKTMTLRRSDGPLTVYTHQNTVAGYGPSIAIETLAGAPLVSAGNDRPGTLAVTRFRILESGPIQALVQLDGQFIDPGGASLCTADTTITPYQSFPFSMAARFYRGQSRVDMEWSVTNACSDLINGQWTDQAVRLNFTHWDFTFASGSGASRQVHAGGGATLRSDATSLRVVQHRGTGTPWTRSAEVLNGLNTVLDSAESFSTPIAGISGDNLIAAAHMPWMRFREPQALSANNQRLRFEPVAESIVLGEGKGLWFQGRLDLAVADGADPTTLISTWRNQAQAAQEHGLIPHAPLTTLNATGLFPHFPDDSASPAMNAYRQYMALLHDQTVRDTPCTDATTYQGGQWTCAKTFGLQLWPDVQFSGRDGFVENARPEDNDVKYNYWNASGAELEEFLRSGDPRWIWDFALPQSWLQAHTAYLNLGSRAGNTRNGFAVESGGVGDGQWHRNGGGSDDYSYNRGLHLAYALRPSPLLADRFAQMGQTIIDRYSVPQAQQGSRDEYLQRVEISRGQFQHFEGLANCAEFVSGSMGLACDAKLRELLAELATDNLSAGIFCQADVPSTSCFYGQQFMVNAMFYPFLMRLYRNYASTLPSTLATTLQNALIQAPRRYLEFAIPRRGDQSIDVSGVWAEALTCTLSSDFANVQTCTPTATEQGNLYFENRPHTLALLFMAEELQPDAALCTLARRALDETFPGPDPFGFISDYARGGWWKGSAQVVQALMFAPGGYQRCAP